MGVYGFGSFLDVVDNVRSRRYNVSSDVPPNNINVVAIDLNSVIHDIAQSIVADINVSIITPELLAQGVVQYIETQSLLYYPAHIIVAVDGIPPLPKINQQRMRRLNYPLPEANMKGWSPIFISVATSWMQIIHQQISLFVREKSNITYSPYTEIGEGEHKLMDIIRRDFTSGNIMIQGLDSDLILIAAINTTKDRHFIVQRNRYILVDEVISILQKEFLMNASDFVFLCSLVGNDFVPPCGECIDLRRSLTMICHSYKSIKSKEEKFSLTAPVSYWNLMRVLERVDMNNLRPNNLLTYDKRYPFNYSFFIYQYHRHMIEPVSDELVANFLIMMKWTLQYYINNNVAHDYAYKYQNAPLIYDIINYIRKNKDTVNAITVAPFSKYLVTERQLKLVTIPPWFEMQDYDSRVQDLFPFCYIVQRDIYTRVTKDGKEHGHPRTIVPFVEYQRLIKL